MKICTFSFPFRSQFQQKCIDHSVNYLKQNFTCSELNTIEEAFDSSFKKSILIFFVTSLDDFIRLGRCNFSEDNTNLLFYFLPRKEFSQITRELLHPLEEKSVVVAYSYQQSHSLVFPGINKITDTIIHNTVGTKYRGIQAGASVPAFFEKDMTCEYNKIRELGAFLKKHRLDPDQYAGSVAMRYESGMLITAHHTNKYHITDERICFIPAYDQHQDFITWIGPHKPSSETSIAWLAFREFKKADFMLHFHYKPITYSEKFKRYRTHLYEPYGTLAEAKAVVKMFSGTDGFAIARGHGELIIGESIEEIEQKILSILAHL